MERKKLKSIFSLKNKIVVITGGTGLLGKQHAEAIAEAGGVPLLLDLNQSRCDSLSSEIRKKYSVDCIGYQVDITKEDQIV